MKDTTVVVNTVMILDKKNAAATAHKNSARLHRETNEPLHTWRHVLMLWKISPYTLSRVVINLQIPQWFALKLSAAIFRLSLLLIPIFLYFINKLNMMNFRFFLCWIDGIWLILFFFVRSVWCMREVPLYHLRATIGTFESTQMTMFGKECIHIQFLIRFTHSQFY